MAVILWGKPSITITAVTGTSADLTVATPVADSTQLTTEAGERHTADIEGGGYEAVRYDRGSFTLEFSVRFAKDRTMPFADASIDGQVTGTYKFEVQEAGALKGAPKLTVNEATVRYEDNYSADGGAYRHYFAESIVPTGDSDQIFWGSVSA